MEYEYRYLSEKTAAEIDAKGFVDNLGRKIHINYGKSVTNQEETIVFQQTWFSHENEEPDKYFLSYKGCYYFIDVFTVDIYENVKDGYRYWCFQYNVVDIHSSTKNKNEYSLSELLKELKKFYM